MNRRLLLATVAVVVLVGLAGCATIFGGISDEELDAEADYDDLQDGEANVTVDVESAGLFGTHEYRVVYDLDDTETLSLSQSRIYTEDPLDVHAVRYWYPNGTEKTGSELHVEQSRSSTEIRVPDGNGTLAYTGTAGGKTFQHPAPVADSYEVFTPPDHRTSNFLFGNVNPGGYEREVVDDREHLYWEQADSTISLRYYHTRDIPIFTGVVAVTVLVGGAGIGYVYRQVKRLQERREEMGLDVDVEDDGRDPPPGMP